MIKNRNLNIDKVLLDSLQLEILECIKPNTNPGTIKLKMKKKKSESRQLKQLTRNQVECQQCQQNENNETVNQVTKVCDINQLTQTEDKLTRKHVECLQSEGDNETLKQLTRNQAESQQIKVNNIQ